MSLETDLQALKSLSRKPRTAAEFTKLLAFMKGESDFAVALICSALLEEATEALIVANMITLRNEEFKRLFRAGGTLSTLSARIKLGYALGLIGKTTERHLDLVREIRNAFAHSRRLLTFDTPEVAQVCKRINLAAHVVGSHSRLPLIAKPRDKFIGLSTILWNAIDQRARAGRGATLPPLP